MESWRSNTTNHEGPNEIILKSSSMKNAIAVIFFFFIYTVPFCQVPEPAVFERAFSGDTTHLDPYLKLNNLFLSKEGYAGETVVKILFIAVRGLCKNSISELFLTRLLVLRLTLMKTVCKGKHTNNVQAKSK
jgi:hypothetical protein